MYKGLGVDGLGFKVVRGYRGYVYYGISYRTLVQGSLGKSRARV